MNKMDKIAALWTLAVFCAALAAVSCVGGASPAGGETAARRAAAQAMREGNQAFEREEFRDAMDAYDRAVESMPEDPRPLYNSANALYMQNRFFEAIEKYEDALKRADPDFASDIYSSMCRAILESGDAAGAVESCESALEIDPNNRIAKRALEEATQTDDPPEEEEPAQQQGQQGDQAPQPGGGQPQDQQQPGGGQQQPAQQQPNQPNQPPQPGGAENPPSPDGERQPADDGGNPGGAGGDPGDQSGGPGGEPSAVPPTGLTEEQARRLLESAGDQTDALPRRSWDDAVPGPRSGRDW